MGRGYVKIIAAADAPIRGLPIMVRDIYGEVLYELHTDEDGAGAAVAVDTPDAGYALEPEGTMPRFALVDVETPGTAAYAPLILRNVPVFDGVTAIQPFKPEPRGDEADDGLARRERALAPVFGVQLPHEQTGACRCTKASALPPALPGPVTVHMGNPAAEAPDIRMPFIDYIKTAASCELYPVWPEAALEANIHCIIAAALQRIQSGYYRRARYPFDITASAAFDPFYIHGRPVYDNIGVLVDRALAERPVFQGGQERPLPYCNGVTTVCPGLAQWGTVAMAQEGAGALEILRHYFGPDLSLVPRIGGETPPRRHAKTALWGAVLLAWRMKNRQAAGLIVP